MLTLINAILGGEGALQGQFGVDTSIDRLTLVFVEFVKNNHGLGDGISIIVQDNGAYLAVLVNLLYHIVFALVLYIVYLLLLFILLLLLF